ncbi:MAG: hypothetical protein JNJ73_01985 [Hyphomonadaceae bacterium]|nr:hypothetical protein [Hyphomonadaceae bacterium]
MDHSAAAAVNATDFLSLSHKASTLKMRAGIVLDLMRMVVERDLQTPEDFRSMRVELAALAVVLLQARGLPSFERNGKRLRAIAWLQGLDGEGAEDIELARLKVVAALSGALSVGG